MLRKIFVLAVAVLVACVCAADVKLPNIIGNNMVLQQKSKVKIWGWADAGEKIEVRPLWQKSSVQTVADKDGKWLVKIETPKAGGPFAIAIKANNEIILQNVMVGEVWVCSGQSNMQMSVRVSANAEEEIANAKYPAIRLFGVPNVIAGEPADNCGGEWQVCSADTVGGFSAAGYFFGRELFKNLNVPVGLINSSWGGTPAEAWTSDEYMKKDADFEPILQRYAEAEKVYPEAMKKYKEETLPNWQKAKDKAKAEGQREPDWPGEPFGPNHPHRPGGLYNAMIAPLLNYGIKGAIWYQGESNAGRAYQYRKLFPNMIENWRADFKQSELPFYFVQIAPFNYGDQPTGIELMEAQLLTLKNVKNTGMAVTNDLAPDIYNIHPTNKQDVGKRLGLWALAKDYGKKGIVYSGPIYKEMDVENNKIRLSFDYDGGLVAKGGELKQFQIAGEDKNFVDAKAVIDGKSVVVSSDAVSKPVAVRYCWSNIAIGNLYNGGDLPASPFRTDDWPGVTINNK